MEASKRLWAAAVILSAELNQDVIEELVRAFLRGEDMNVVLTQYIGEDLHGLSLKGPQVINSVLEEVRL
jgi:hypothetical protein